MGMLFSRKAVHSALFLAMTMINLAILYVSLSAPFLGMVQVIVYTGAIAMLFLFVLMVVGVDSSDSLIETVKNQRAPAILFGLGFGVLLVGILGQGTRDLPVGSLEEANSVTGGNLQGLAELIFTQYVFAFEVTSTLLITAALGAMILTHQQHYEPKATQRELSQARFRGRIPARCRRQALSPGTTPSTPQRCCPTARWRRSRCRGPWRCAKHRSTGSTSRRLTRSLRGHDIVVDELGAATDDTSGEER